MFADPMRLATAQSSMSKGRFRALKKIESNEARIIRHLNYGLSKALARLAIDFDCGIGFEDLSGIRKRTKQRRTTKSDAVRNHENAKA
jgi:hypothetical protein